MSLFLSLLLRSLLLQTSSEITGLNGWFDILMTGSPRMVLSLALQIGSCSYCLQSLRGVKMLSGL